MIVNVSVGADGTVFAVDDAGNVARYVGGEGGATWQPVPGPNLSVVAVVGARKAWGIDLEVRPGTASNIYSYDGSKWSPVPGYATMIAAGPDGLAWHINDHMPADQSNIWRWDGSTWVAVPGRATFIAVGAGGAVWHMNSRAPQDQQVYAWHWSGGWAPFPGMPDRATSELEWIALADDRNGWGTDENGSVDAPSTLFRQLDGEWSADQGPPAGRLAVVNTPPAAGGSETVWGCSVEGELYRRRMVVGPQDDSGNSERVVVWDEIDTSGFLPTPTPEAIGKAETNLDGMYDLLQDSVSWYDLALIDAYALMQIKGKPDPGQSFANLVVSNVFSALGAVPVPGSGIVGAALSGAYNYAVTSGSGGDLNQAFASATQRFKANVQAAMTRVSALNTQLRADPARAWNTRLYDPVRGTSTTVEGISTLEAPLVEGQTFYNDLLFHLQDLNEYELYKGLLRTLWRRVVLVESNVYTYSSEDAVRKSIKDFVDRNPAYYLTYRWVDDGWGPFRTRGWVVTRTWLGYGNFPFGHTYATADLCTKLFKDDGLGNVVRPAAVATRAEVFNEWGLAEQPVVMPSSAYGRGAPRTATERPADGADVSRSRRES